MSGSDGAPSSIGDLFAPLALRLVAGDLELRGLGDDDLVALARLAERGIHEPGSMPFYVPWTEAEPGDLARNTVQYHWRARADFGPAAWALHLGVWRGDTLVGTQGFETSDYLVTRTGETGSWLGQEFQGQGIGTTMRRAMCALVFDHLDGAEVTSGAFVDNPASLGVSRKVGYRHDGTRRMRRRAGELALNQRLVVTPETFVRGDVEVQVIAGLEGLRRAVGLDSE